MTEDHPNIIRKKDILNDQRRAPHPLDDSHVRFTSSLGSKLGFTHIGVHSVVVKPGTTSCVFHFHKFSDEFAYIISGEGIVRIGDKRYQISAGDLIGSPANGQPHSIENNTNSDIVYLMVGNSPPVDICVYPEKEKTGYIYKDGEHKCSDFVDDRKIK
eukprot:TRINITY_DN7762_c0_g1_i2.p1 TRINITY_DN7762_c0_g1~~TRINITY_DN7762_c0_g1_i2.p1  ORF type:complete len:158 (+),score=33.57 TRINITY_DN7762_c0_g1_i2:95-568(+)